MAGCDEDCLDCVGYKEDECVRCAGNAHLVPAKKEIYIGKCECNAGLCPRPDAMHCSLTPCHPSCSTCSGCGSKDCLGCTDPKATLNKGECKCNTANWCLGPDESTGMCLQGCLAKSCLTCSDCKTCSSCYPNASISGKDCKCTSGSAYTMFDATNCVNTCGSFMSAGKKACTCDTGYYPKDDFTCGKCSSLCLTCSGPGGNECLTCSDSHANISSPGTCTCVRGYYPNPDATSCSPCDPTCDSCTGPNNSDCYSCAGKVVLSSPAPASCKCSSGQNWDGSVCQPCDMHCDSCVNINSSDCLTCVDLYAYVPSTPGTCVCAPGAYGTPNTCGPCYQTCLTCGGTMVNDCLSCYSNAHTALDGSCICNDGYWPDTDSSNCTPCDVTCGTCTLPTSCTSCIPHSSPSVPFCACDSTYYFDTVLTQCISCHPSCQTCSNPTDCVSCFPPAILSSGICICDPGYYPSSPGICLMCDLSCETCANSGPMNCLTCLNFAELGSNNACKCVTNAYPNPDVRHCALCDSTCSSCLSSGSSGCLTCHPGAYIPSTPPSNCVCLSSYYPSPDSSTCLPCDSSCLTCSDQSTCLSCHPFASLQPDNTCICPETYYGLPISCIACPSNCQKCDITGCLECIYPWFVYENDCIQTCPKGYIRDNEGCAQGDATPPEPGLYVNLNNSLIVWFSKPMVMNLTTSDMNIAVTDPENSLYSVLWSPPIILNTTHFLVNLTIESRNLPEENECLLTFLYPDRVVDTLGVAIIKDQLIGKLHSYSDSSASNTTAIQAQATAMAQGSVGAVAATSFISGSPTSLWSLMNQLQLITYIPMTTIPLPSRLMDTLTALNVASFVPNPFQYLLPANETSQIPPDFAQNYGIDSSLFLLNIGLMLTAAVALVAGFLPVYIASKSTSGRLSDYFSRLLPSFKWGIPLRWWFQTYLDMSLFSYLQIYQIVYIGGISSPIVTCNFLLSVLFASLSIVTIPLSYLFIWTNYRRIVSRIDPKFNKTWGSFYMEFDPNSGVNGALYYPLFLTRRLIYAVTIITLSAHPTAQALINTSIAFSVRTLYRPLYMC